MLEAALVTVPPAPNVVSRPPSALSRATASSPGELDTVPPTPPATISFPLDWRAVSVATLTFTDPMLLAVRGTKVNVVEVKVGSEASVSVKRATLRNLVFLAKLVPAGALPAGGGTDEATMKSPLG